LALGGCYRTNVKTIVCFIFFSHDTLHRVPWKKKKKEQRKKEKEAGILENIFL
jgi:hypothetical protein